MVRSLATVLLMVAARSTLGGGRFNADALRQRLQDAAAPPADAAGQTQTALDEHARQLQGLAEEVQGIDELPQVTEDLTAAKADRLKSIQPDLKKKVQGALGGLEDIDAQVQEQVTGLLGEQAGDVLGQLQEHKRATLGIRLLGR